jgi:hypothetical protein
MAKRRRRKARKACVRTAKRVVCGTLVKSGKRRRRRRRSRK